MGELRDGLLVLRGRAGERINRGGEKHHPLDIEHRWRGAGLTGRFAAVAVEEPALGDDIALVATEQPVAEVRALYERSPLRPAAIQFGGYLVTVTGKPRRRAMSRPLAARRLAPARYDRLLRHAAATARRLLDSGTDDPALRSLAEHTAARHTGTGDDTVLAAYDFLREHWHAPDDGALARAKAWWRGQLFTALRRRMPGGPTVMAIPVLSASVAARAREAIGFQHTRLRAALKAGRLHDEAAESFATPKADFAIVPARPLTGTAPAGPAIRSVWRATSEALSSPRVPHSWPGSTSTHRTHLCTRLRRPYRDGGRIGTVTDPLLMAFGTMSV
ncbi:hypothetical protein SANTM175S_01424 [Streptomyces antimycoticus]